jgi:DNA polymerase-3 subunit alpha
VPISGEIGVLIALMKVKTKTTLPIDLHAHSMYSIYDGMGTSEGVVLRAKELGWNAACLTEHGNLMSAPSFYKECNKHNIKPILGMEAYVVPDEHLGNNSSETKKCYHLTMLALSKEGYHNLVTWSTFSNRRDEQYQNFYGKPRISFSAMMDIAPYPLHHNVVFSGCLSGELLSFINNSNGGGWYDGSIAYLKMMQSIFPNFYIELQNHRIEKYADKGFSQYEELLKLEDNVEKCLIKLHEDTKIPLVVTNDSHLQRPSQRKSHMALKAVTWQHGEGEMDRYSQAALAKQLDSYTYFGNYLRDMDEVADGVKYGKQALENIVDIVNEANIQLEAFSNPSYSIPSSGYVDPESMMRKRSQKRLGELVALYGDETKERFELEISSMGDFANYLLIVSDICIWAKSQGILINTRGSASASLLCYCLNIHDIDPMPGGYDLLFSRFFNPERKKVPDIDLDIERDRYEDIVRFVKEYMKEREGPGQVVQICNLGTLANRSAFKMMAEAIGIDKQTQDDISKLLPSMIDSGMVDEEEDVYVTLREEYPDLYELAAGVFDSIKSVSQHACGWLVGTRNRSIEDWVPLCLIASSNSMVTQYDMKILEEIGLTKLDLLRLKTLSVIQRTRKQLGQNSLDITDIPLDDKKTFDLIKSGKTEGIFTLQGKEIRRGVIEMQPENVQDIIDAVAVYRPALTREEKDVSFIKRRRGEEEPYYPHQIAKNATGRTYGIPVYQEDAMQLCYEIGMTHGEVGDILSAIKKAKGVGRGAKEAFQKIKPTFVSRAREFGLSKQETKEVWSFVKAYAGYSFNRAHAASYGILATRAAYLKANHPQEFYSSLLDVYPEKFKYIAAARAEGFSFIPPDINYSNSGFSKGEEEDSIRVGLSRIGGLGGVSISEIVKGQPFASFSDFKDRTSNRALHKGRIEILSAIGAFDSLGIERPEEYSITKKKNKKEYKYNLKGHSLIEYFILGFCLSRPDIFQGIHPSHTNKTSKRQAGSWRHDGLYRGCELTEGPVSVSKLFWIPPLYLNDIYSVKASAWAKVKTHLLTVVDEQGIPFEIKASEQREDRTKAIQYLAKKCRGSVICLDGRIGQPYLFDGPLTFSYFRTTGAWQNDPQMWGAEDSDKNALISITKSKR